MRRILIIFMLLLSFSSVSYGAVSQDIYVRKDVFEVEMKNLNANIEKILTKLDNLEKNVNELTKTVAVLAERIDGVNKSLSERIDGLNKSLSERIDGVNTSLSRRIDGLEKQVENSNTFLYYILVLFGAMLVMPLFNRWWEERKEKRKVQPVTLEDVKRLIAEAQLGSRPQI